MVRLAKHRAPAPKLQHWQHLANLKAHMYHLRLWLTDARAELVDAWHTYKTK